MAQADKHFGEEGERAPNGEGALRLAAAAAASLLAQLRRPSPAALLRGREVGQRGKGPGAPGVGSEIRGPTAGEVMVESHPRGGEVAGGRGPGRASSKEPLTSLPENQEVKLKERILSPLTQGLLSSLENAIRKEKAGLKGNAEESRIHA